MTQTENANLKLKGGTRTQATKKNANKMESASSSSTFFTCFIVIALLGVWTSIAVVYFNPIDYEEVLGKLAAYDTDGDGDFDLEDAKMLLGMKTNAVHMASYDEDDVDQVVISAHEHLQEVPEPEVPTEASVVEQEQEEEQEEEDEREEESLDHAEIFEEEPEAVQEEPSAVEMGGPVEDLASKLGQSGEMPTTSQESGNDIEEPATEWATEDHVETTEEEEHVEIAEELSEVQADTEYDQREVAVSSEENVDEAAEGESAPLYDPIEEGPPIVLEKALSSERNTLGDVNPTFLHNSIKPTEEEPATAEDENEEALPEMEEIADIIEEDEVVLSDDTENEEVFSDDTENEEVFSDDTENEAVFSDDTENEDVLSDDTENEADLTDDTENEEVFSDDTENEEVLTDETENEAVFSDDTENEDVLSDDTENEADLTDDTENEEVFSDDTENEEVLTDETENEAVFSDDTENEADLTDDTENEYTLSDNNVDGTEEGTTIPSYTEEDKYAETGDVSAEAVEADAIVRAAEELEEELLEEKAVEIEVED
ncbi:uncharacterized protein LOC144029600 isoform X2 [Festucalex cinctus]